MKNASTDKQEINVYEQLFLNASEGLVLTNERGEIIEANPKCCSLFKYERAELIGERIEILVPEKFRKRHEGHRSKFHKQPENRSMGMGMNLLGRKKDGTTFPIEISLNYYGEGKDLKVMALVSDITTRVEIESRIKSLNEKLELKVSERTKEVLRGQNLYVAIARNFPDGTISVFDKNLNYTFFEGKELYKAGIKSENLIGTSIENRLPEDVRGEVIVHLKNVFKGESGIIEFETKGQVFELNAVPLFDDNNAIHQILVVDRNITKQKNAESEILNSLNQEKALNELKSRFVSMASHEFRTPLSTILSSISLISKYNGKDEGEKIEKHIGRIKSSVQNLTGILNDFLSLDKLEEGKIKTNPRKVNIVALIDDIIDELEAVLKEKQEIRVDYSLENNNIYIDSQMVKNIVINLTSNAIKYSSAASVIELSIGVNTKHLTIEVIDNGIGIPKNEQDQLFERFFRAKNVTNIGGTGLGLNIVKKYVDLLNGSIDFESEESKGTRVRVKLPVEIMYE